LAFSRLILANFWFIVGYVILVDCSEGSIKNSKYEIIKVVLLTTMIIFIVKIYQKHTIENEKKEIYYDKSTKLIWYDNKDSKTIQKNWYGAINYCKNLEFAGYDDWHLPDYNQLLTLLDYTKYMPTVKNEVKNTASNSYWSASSFIKDKSFAWYVNIGNGNTNSDKKLNIHYVRCVREKKIE